MAFYSKIKLEGQGSTYESATLQNYHFDFNRRLDSLTLSAVGALEHFKMNFEVLSEGGAKDAILFKWFISNYTDMKGTISLYSGGDAGSPLSKEIKFETGKIFKFEENFDRHGANPVSIDIGIVAVLLNYNDIIIDTTDNMMK
jgi:hypothetical protein